MNYFKTDGIRGIYPLEVNEVLFKAVGRVIARLGYEQLIMGYDNRPSSISLADALIKGALAARMKVFNLGLSTTPRIEFESFNKKCVGAMITASHNPSNYNGLKIFVEGEKLSKTQEELISNSININDDYSNHLLQYKPYIYNNRIVIDCANGAASIIAAKIFNDSNFLIYNNRIEEEINYNCGATHPEALQAIVRHENADMGFSFDGDGDRVIACDRCGNILDGDYLCFLLALYLRRKNKFNNKVVLTKMSNLGIINVFKEEQIEVILSDTGDKNVLAAMNKENVVIGSEASGHIILKDYKPYGDGILNVLLILSAINELGLSLEDIYNKIKKTPSALINIERDELSLDLSNFKNTYSYIRKSGTERCYRVFIQSEDKNEFLTCLEYINEYKNK